MTSSAHGKFCRQNEAMAAGMNGNQLRESD
jgi:hypothetical protein